MSRHAFDLYYARFNTELYLRTESVLPDRVVYVAAFRMIFDEHKSISKSSVTIFQHTLGTFRFENILIFKVQGSRSVRTLTRRIVLILLLEYGG